MRDGAIGISIFLVGCFAVIGAHEIDTAVGTILAGLLVVVGWLLLIRRV